MKKPLYVKRDDKHCDHYCPFFKLLGEPLNGYDDSHELTSCTLFNVSLDFEEDDKDNYEKHKRFIPTIDCDEATTP